MGYRLTNPLIKVEKKLSYKIRISDGDKHHLDWKYPGAKIWKFNVYTCFFQGFTFGLGEVVPRSGCYVLTGQRSVSLLPRRWRSKVSYYPGNKMLPEFKKDRVPEGYDFIFSKSNRNYFTLGIPAVVIAWVGAMGLVAFIGMKILAKKEKELKSESLRHHTDSIVHFIYFSAVFLPAMIFFFMQRARNVMLRMYFNKSTGQYYGVILRYGLYKKYVTFQQADVKILPKLKNFANINVCGYNVLMSDVDFASVQDFNRFMRYDMKRESSFMKGMSEEEYQKLEELAKERVNTKTDIALIRSYMQKHQKMQLEKAKVEDHKET